MKSRGKELNDLPKLGSYSLINLLVRNFTVSAAKGEKRCLVSVVFVPTHDSPPISRCSKNFSQLCAKGSRPVLHY